MALVVSQQVGDSLSVGEDVRVSVAKVMSGGGVILRIRLGASWRPKPVIYEEILQLGEKRQVTPDVSVKVCRSLGRRVWLAVAAPRDQKIWRGEIPKGATAPVDRFNPDV